MTNQTGWKPQPVALKILFVVFVLWVIGSVMGLPTRFEQGLPLFGMMVTGVVAAIVVLLLDVAGPISFLVASWNRLSWGPTVGYVYNGIFILNGIVALFTVSADLGLPQILIPTVISAVFVVTIYFNRDYFSSK